MVQKCKNSKRDRNFFFVTLQLTDNLLFGRKDIMEKSLDEKDEALRKPKAELILKDRTGFR